jgi:hypothetical protein
MSEASEWERYLLSQSAERHFPTVRSHLQYLMVTQLAEAIDRQIAQILTQHRSYLAVREQRGDSPSLSDAGAPPIERVRSALEELRQALLLEAMQSLEVLLAAQ